MQLLRGLPDPAPPITFADDVMARLADGEGRPSAVFRLLQRAVDPRVSLPLAAGLAGLLLLTSADLGRSPQSIAVSPVAPTATQMAAVRALSVPTQLAVDRVVAASRTETVHDGLGAAFFGRVTPRVGMPDFESPHDRGVTDAFARMQRSSGAESHAQVSLVHAAASRAPVVEIGRLLRGSGHPHSESLATHFLSGEADGR